MLYQQIDTSTGEPIGVPGELPADFVGIADVYLANLDLTFGAQSMLERGYNNRGFIPVADGTTGGVPSFVKRHQAKIAMVDAGLYDAAVGWVAASTDPKLKIYFNEADNFARNNEYVLTFAGLNGITEEQLDMLFIAASQVP